MKETDVVSKEFTQVTKLVLGRSQMWSGLGYIDVPPEKCVIHDKWFLMANLKTRLASGRTVTVRCMFLEDLATTFEQQFRKGDTVYLQGEVDEYRAGFGYDNLQIKNVIHVLSFAFILDYHGQVEPLSLEKAEWLQACSDLFDQHAPMPTIEETLAFKELREKRAQQNRDRREKAGKPIGKNKY